MNVNFLWLLLISCSLLLLVKDQQVLCQKFLENAMKVRERFIGGRIPGECFIGASCTNKISLTGEVRLCFTAVHNVCRLPGSFYEIPGDARQLLSNCPSLTDYLECLHSYDLACAGRSEYTGLSPPLYYNRIKSLLDNVCDETSSLYNVLGRSLSCIKLRVSRSDIICSSTKNKVLDAYENHLATKSNKRTLGSQLKKQCLSLIATVACMMDDIEQECGFFAHEAVNDIILQSQIFPDECGLDIFLELKGIIEELNLDSDTEDNLKKYFVVEIE